MSEKLNNLSEKLAKEKPLALKHSNFVKPGWMEVFVTNLPSEGKYYPENIKIYIRAGKGEEAVTWSMIDENDPISVQEGMNSILSRCCELFADDKILDWRDICEEDRLTILLMIRDMTYPEPENVLISNVKCDCEKGEVEIKYNNLNLSRVSNTLEKYYDPTKRLYVIKSKSYGDIIMRPPSVGVSLGVLEYIKECRNKGAKLNQALLKILPYMALEWRELSKNFAREVEVEMIPWDAKKVSFYMSLVDKLAIGPNMTIHGDCRNCKKTRLEGPLNFLGGIKSLFIISDLDSELL